MVSSGILVKSFLLSWIAQKLPQYQSSERAQQHNAELRLKLNKTDNLYHVSWLQPRQQKHNASINHCIHLYTIPLRPWLLTKSQESHNIASMDRFESGGNRSRQASQKQDIQPMKLEKDFNVWKDEQKHATIINHIPRWPLTFGQYMLANSSHEVDTLSDPGAPVLSQRKNPGNSFLFHARSAVVWFAGSKPLDFLNAAVWIPAGRTSMQLRCSLKPKLNLKQCSSVTASKWSHAHFGMLHFPSHVSSLQEIAPNEKEIE